VREKIYIGALLVAIGTFHAATVRQGHLWADDFAMYVHHAQNIAEGRPYADTGYIFTSIVVGPKYYPPIFPLLLTPIYKVSGLNLIPMKLGQVVFLLLSLIAIHAYWRRDLGSGYTLALIAIVGFAPAFWTAKDNVLFRLGMRERELQTLPHSFIPGGDRSTHKTRNCRTFGMTIASAV
jgi:hypothetical protein